MDNQFIQEQLNSLHAQGASTEQAVKDLSSRFDKVAAWMEKLDTKVNLKADETDLKSLAEKHAELDSKVTWIRATSAAISGAIGLVIGILTVWFTGHPNLPH